MRICMFNNLFPPIKSGSSHFSYKLSRMLAERGHEVTVVAAKIAGTTAHEEREGLDIYRLPCIMMPQLEIAHKFKYFSYTFTPGNLRRLVKLCQEKRFDVLHQHGQIFDTSLSSAYLAGKFGIPLLTTIHTPVRHTVPLYSKILTFLDKTVVKHLIIRHAQLLIAPDQTVVDNINERYQHSWVEEIPYGVDRLDASPERGLEVRRKYNLGDRPVILSLGHVHNLRDRCDLIAAMPEIIKKIPNVHLLIVGDIYTQKPVEMVNDLGIKAHVTFTGGIPHEEIGAYLAASTIEAAWSRAAPGLGIAAMEAMLFGRAVVSSIGTDAFGKDTLGKDILQPGENIMLIDRDSIPSIAAAITKLLCEPDFRQRMEKNAHDLIEKYFSWENVTNKMENIYQKLIEKYPRT